MRRFRKLRSSPALIVAAVALAVAFTATAVAGPQAVISALTKKDKKQVKKIANKQIDKKAPGLSVKSAETAKEVGYAHHFNITTGPTGGQDFLTIGPFTFDVKCEINVAGEDIATIEIRSSVDHASFDASPEIDDMVAGTKYEFESLTAPTGATEIEANQGSSGGVAPDGTAFVSGGPVIELNPFSHPGTCQFGSVIFAV